MPSIIKLGQASRNYHREDTTITNLFRKIQLNCKNAVFLLNLFTTLSTLYLYFLPFSHSLLASKLLAKVAEKFGVELSVTNLFAHSTVSVMARLLDSKLHQNAGGDAVVMEPTLDLKKEVEMHDQNMLR